MFSMSKETQKIIEARTQRKISEILEMSPSDENELVSKLKGKSLEFPSAVDSRRIGRGNPLLARKRVRTLDAVEQRIDEICKDK